MTVRKAVPRGAGNPFFADAGTFLHFFLYKNSGKLY